MVGRGEIKVNGRKLFAACLLISLNMSLKHYTSERFRYPGPVGAVEKLTFLGVIAIFKKNLFLVTTNDHLTYPLNNAEELPYL